MDTALVTGADRGIGLQIARQLVEIGYRVYGLAADFSACNWQHHDFLQIRCDLSSAEHLRQAWEHIAKHNPQVGAVVHALRSPVFENGFEGAAAQDIAYCVQSCLLAPLLLTRWALPSLVRFRGHVICVGWNAQGSCPQCAAAAAAEGGLYHWSQSLFDELRDTGVKVCTVYPWRNPGDADPKARLKLEPQSEVDAKFVARAVAQVLQTRENNLMAQVVVRPQGTREEPRIAAGGEPLPAGPRDIVLPDPDKRPPPPVPIPTPEPHRPDDAWEFDDEDEDAWEEDDELDALLESSRRILREQNETARRQLQRTRKKAGGRQERGDSRKDKDREHAAGRGGQQRTASPSDTRTAPSPSDARTASPSDAKNAPSPSAGGAADRRSAIREQAPPAPLQPAAGNLPQPSGAAALEGDGDPSADESKRRRRRRRGGRGRNRRQGAEGIGDPNGGDAVAAASAATAKPASGGGVSANAADAPKPVESRQPADTRRAAPGKSPATRLNSARQPTDTRAQAAPEATAPPASKSNAERASVASKAPAEPKAAADLKSPAQPKPPASAESKPTARPPAPASSKPSASSKPAPKPATKPDAKTAEVKPAKKKTAVKKAAVKKTAVKKVAVKKVARKAAVQKATVKKTAVKKTTVRGGPAHGTQSGQDRGVLE